MTMKFIAIGTSLGGTGALQKLLPMLQPTFDAAITLVLHRAQGENDSLLDFLQKHCRLHVEEAQDKTPIKSGWLYFAPADYHLLVEDNHFALSTDAAVSYARPSIDVLFESAAEAYGKNAVGIVLTGSGYDGASGLAAIKRHGGTTIIQTPDTAECSSMPNAALATAMVDVALSVESIVPFLVNRQHLIGAP